MGGIQSSGHVETAGASVWENSDLTGNVDFIKWGVLAPGSNRTFTYYIRNEQSSNTIFKLETINWNPENASKFISLSWNLENVSLAAKQLSEFQITITVSREIHDVNHFTFDIVIYIEQT